MTKRINKDGSLNYFEILKEGLDKVEVIVLSIINVIVLSCLISIFTLNAFGSFEGNILRALFFLLLISIPYMITIRSIFYLYKKNFYEKDLKNIKKISKQSYKKLEEEMNKLSHSIFILK